jgi:hypothetical protein
MKPVDQEFLHNAANNVQGDCFRAVMASILELPIASVPHFAALYRDIHEFWNQAYDWLEAQGYEYTFTTERPEGALDYHTLGGPSPRNNGTFHLVVALNGIMVHDPHPSRAGIVYDPANHYVGWLIPITE